METFGRVLGSEVFITNALKEKIQFRNENKVSFPKHMKIIKTDKDGSTSSVQLTPPETYCRFPRSKNLEIITSGDVFVEYSFKNPQQIHKLKSKMKEKSKSGTFREYGKYTTAKGYR